MKKEVNSKKKDKNKNIKLIIIGIITLIIIIGIVIFINIPKKSYAANSLYDAVENDANAGRGSYYLNGTNDCYSVDTPNRPPIDSACDNDNTSLYCLVKKDTYDEGYGGIYTEGTGDCYSVDAPNGPSVTSNYKATFYYQSNSTSGSTTISSVEATCEASGDSCTADIPSAVRSSVGTYNNAYAGLSTTTGTMNASVGASATTVTLSEDVTYYSVYRSSVTNYYYN